MHIKTLILKFVFRHLKLYLQLLIGCIKIPLLFYLVAEKSDYGDVQWELLRHNFYGFFFKFYEH